MGGGQQVRVRGSSLSPPVPDGLDVFRSPEFSRFSGPSEIFEFLLQSEESSEYIIMSARQRMRPSPFARVPPRPQQTMLRNLIFTEGGS